MIAWIIPLSFEQPRLVWAIAPAVAVAYVLARKSLAGLSPVRWWSALLVRCVVASMLIMALAGAQWERSTDNLSVIYVFDISRSIPESQRLAAWSAVQKACAEIGPDDRVGVLAFDGESYIEQLPQRPGPEGGLHIDKLALPLTPDRTDLARAVRLASAMFPDDTAKRLVLLTDGNQTEGDVMTEIQTASASGIAVDVVPLRYEHQNEVMFESLTAPPYAHLNEVTPLRLLLRSQKRTTGSLELYHNGEKVDLDPDRAGLNGEPVVLEPGVNPFVLRIPLRTSSAHRFEARFVPDREGDDEIAHNNTSTAFTTVEGPSRVLFLTHPPDASHVAGDDFILIDALRQENINVDVVDAEAAQIDAVTLQQFAAVILANCPADLFTDSQQRALATYTRDLGGGLIMLGGDDSYGAGGWQGSVVEAVMPVRFDVDEMKHIPRGALVVIMHACEFANGNMWATEVGIKAMKTLSRLDYFGMVDWSGMGESWAVPLQLCEDKSGIERRIRKMSNADMPDYHVSMQMALKGLKNKRDAAQRHVILISDGDASQPSPKLLNDYRGAKVTVSTISIFPHGGFGGTGTLRDIATKTGGNFYSLNKAGDEKKLPQIFVKEAKVVRRPLLREERFQPRIRHANSELMDGVGSDLPALGGYVVTTARSLSEISLPIVSDKGDPVLAHWLCGLGRSVAFTSGWWTHWGDDWPDWSRFSKLWAQTVRWAMSRGDAANFEVNTRIEGKVGKVKIEALNKDTAYVNFMQMRGVVVGPDGTSIPIRMQQTGPGVYEADFSAADAGSYLVSVQAKSTGDEPAALIRTGVSVSYSSEFRELSANESLLHRITDEAKYSRMMELGSLDPTEIFAHNLPETITRQPIWNLMMRLALAMFLLDVAVRRIAIDPRAMAKRVRGFIADMAGRLAPGHGAEAVLTDLKTRREALRADRTAAGGQTDAGQPNTADALKARKFDAGAAVARQPAADLRESLGGADAGSPAAKKPVDAGEKKDESMTSRLLKAKRRVRGPEDGPPGGSGGDQT